MADILYKIKLGKKLYINIKLKRNIQLLLWLLLLITEVTAQPPEPPDPHNLPINGAIPYLLVIGIYYGIKKLKK